MGGKTVARDFLLLRTGGSYSLLLTAEENLGGGRHSSSEAVPAPALRLTRKSGALGPRLSFLVSYSKPNSDFRVTPGFFSFAC
jgi:hypothetical protein